MICKCTTRTLLGVLGIAFWVVAVFLWMVAGFVIVDYRHYDEFVSSHYTLIPAVILVVVGIVFFFGGLLGCCAVIRDNKCSLCMFGTLLLTILILLLTAGTVAYVYRGQVEGTIHNKTMEVVKEKYEVNQTSLVKQVDWLQQTLQCCGADNYKDWETSHWSRAYPGVSGIVPISCCKNESSCGITAAGYAKADEKYVFTNGCYNKFADAIKGNLKLVGGCAVTLIVILALGVISSCILMRIYRNEETPYYSLYS